VGGVADQDDPAGHVRARPLRQMVNVVTHQLVSRGGVHELTDPRRPARELRARGGKLVGENLVCWRAEVPVPVQLAVANPQRAELGARPPRLDQPPLCYGRDHRPPARAPGVARFHGGEQNSAHGAAHSVGGHHQIGPHRGCFEGHLRLLAARRARPDRRHLGIGHELHAFASLRGREQDPVQALPVQAPNAGDFRCGQSHQPAPALVLVPRDGTVVADRADSLVQPERGQRRHAVPRDGQASPDLAKRWRPLEHRNPPARLCQRDRRGQSRDTPAHHDRCQLISHGLIQLHFVVMRQAGVPITRKVSPSVVVGCAKIAVRSAV
jgi:hypothetical protein